MKHPQREEWMAWLYGEVSGKDKAGLASHLDGCAKCQADVKTWQCAMSALEEWKLAPSRAKTRLPQRALQWGIAAALMLGIGFGLGNFVSSASTNRTALRASLKSELRAELMAELKKAQEGRLTEFKQAVEKARVEDSRLLLTAINKVDADRQTDFAIMHKELETVALLTQDSLQRAQRQIVTLASFSQSEGRINSHP